MPSTTIIKTNKDSLTVDALFIHNDASLEDQVPSPNQIKTAEESFYNSINSIPSNEEYKNLPRHANRYGLTFKRNSKNPIISSASVVNGVCSDGTHLWFISSGATKKLYKLDPLSEANAIEFTFTENINGICFDGTYLWITLGNGNLCKLNTSGIVLNTYSILTNPLSIEFDNTYLWIIHDTNKIVKVSTVGIIQSSTTLPSSATINETGMCFDGTYLWVTNFSASSVSKINISNGSIITSIALPQAAIGVCFDGIYIWAGSNKINVLTNSIITTVLSNPTCHICFDGKRIWVQEKDSLELKKIEVNEGTEVVTLTTTYENAHLVFDGVFVRALKDTEIFKYLVGNR